MDVCIVCGIRTVSEADKPCIFCYFKGEYFEQVLLSDERSNVLGRIRGIRQVERADVWHQGHGAFALCIALSDGRLILPGVRVEAQTPEGEFTAVLPAIPPLDQPWGIAVANQQDTSEDIVFMDGAYTDDELVEAIGQVASFNEMMGS